MDMYGRHQHPRDLLLPTRRRAAHNREMRPYASFLFVVLIVFGVYYFYLRQMPTTDKRTAPTQTISLTGVRADLLQIGQAERAFIAQNGRCASLDELVASSTLMMSKPGRDGYSYSADCSGAEFNVMANHSPAPSDLQIRYPKLALDSTMQVREIGD